MADESLQIRLSMYVSGLKVQMKTSIVLRIEAPISRVRILLDRSGVEESLILDVALALGVYRPDT